MKLARMIMEIKFDREIDADKHYISPGGYEIKFKDREYGFDFTSYTGSIDADNKKLLHAEVSDLDTHTFPEANKITPTMFKKASFSEFYIYTGEHGDPEIYPVAVRSCTFEFYDSKTDKIVQKKADKNMLDSINACLTQ